MDLKNKSIIQIILLILGFILLMKIIKGKKCDNFTQAINQPRPTDSNIIDCVKEQIKNWNTNNGNNKIENTVNINNVPDKMNMLIKRREKRNT